MNSDERELIAALEMHDVQYQRAERAEADLFAAEAERDRLADENRALREAIRTHEDLHRPDGPDGPDGPIEMDGWPCCDDDRHLWAAADRGVTDGDRNEGERT